MTGPPIGCSTDFGILRAMPPDGPYNMITFGTVPDLGSIRVNGTPANVLGVQSGKINRSAVLSLSTNRLVSLEAVAILDMSSGRNCPRSCQKL